MVFLFFLPRVSPTTCDRVYRRACVQWPELTTPIRFYQEVGQRKHHHLRSHYELNTSKAAQQTSRIRMMSLRKTTTNTNK